MIGLIGIKKNIGLDIRGRLSLSPKKQKEYLKNLLEVFNEVVIISTCNRTEIYFNSSSTIEKEEILKKIFHILEWDISLKQYIFFSQSEEVVKHLMEVVCGFHSRLLGEDQILGQIKHAYMESIETNGVHDILQRLFQQALTCGKKFRTQCKIFEVPVSSASIAVSKGIEAKAKKFMVLGYGEMGKLTVKYLLSHNIKEIFIVVRNKDVVNDIDDPRVTVLNFKEKNSVINSIDCIISCTAATHTVIRFDDIDSYGNDIIIFDLAVPRDVDKDIMKLNRVTLYDIDVISHIDDTNRELRRERMNSFRYIVDNSVKNYIDWLKVKELTPHICNIKAYGEKIFLDRLETFKNKSKTSEDLELATTLLKSTSDAYINKAIKVLKEERLKGSDDKCLNLIMKIFLEN